jgi:hypothetical protein
MLTATIPAVADADAYSTPIEYRLYAWGATSATGNTHVNLASLSAKFVAVPTLEFNFTGVQNAAPLTALRRQHPNIALTAGLNYGPALSPSSTNNAGNELNVAGFSTGATLQTALDGDHYLSFAVQAVPGIAMYPDSVSFSLWRDSSNSATSYAVFSSADGFNNGAQLAHATHSLVGANNQLTLTGTFTDAQPTTDAVEFRLYGWDAASASDNTHVVRASMRARFASVVGTAVNPTGILDIQGDLYHLAGGTIAVDLGGTIAGSGYDAIHVDGAVQIEGDLAVALADVGGSPFTPALNDSFQILTATDGVSGQFANVDLPRLPWNLGWRVDYSPDAVALTVLTTGDFNHDGFVNAADYVVWRKFGGTQDEYNAWQTNFGTAITGIASFGASAGSAATPEPSSIVLLAIAIALVHCQRAR